jgi:hypothetical protein
VIRPRCRRRNNGRKTDGRGSRFPLGRIKRAPAANRKLKMHPLQAVSGKVKFSGRIGDVLICERCGARFMRRPRAGVQRYCSGRCRVAAHRTADPGGQALADACNAVEVGAVPVPSTQAIPRPNSPKPSENSPEISKGAVTRSQEARLPRSRGICGPAYVLDIEIGPSRTWRSTPEGTDRDRGGR